MTKFPYKVGDRIRIVKKTHLWDSSLGGKYPWNWDGVKLGDVVVIMNIDSDSNRLNPCFNGVSGNDVYGFTYSEFIKDCYELVKANPLNLDEFYKAFLNGMKDEIEDEITTTITGEVFKNYQRIGIIDKEENKMKYEKIKDFTAEDLRKAGACDKGIEKFIKIFGFTKTVLFTEDSIKIMETIEDCIPFLIRKGFIKKTEEIYKTGDKFRNINGSYKNHVYILFAYNNQANLVDVNSGQTWQVPVEVDSSVEISKEEFAKISRGGIFEKIEREWK